MKERLLFLTLIWFSVMAWPVAAGMWIFGALMLDGSVALGGLVTTVFAIISTVASGMWNDSGAPRPMQLRKVKKPKEIDPEWQAFLEFKNRIGQSRELH